MSELIDTTEMYLKTVYELEEDGVPPLRARIVERLDHSGPTVSQTVSRMERDGLIRVGEGRALELTEEGRRKAAEVIRKHRLAERLLLDVIGLDRSLIHDEACRWEHVMSEQVEARLVEILDTVETDPFGNAIPKRGEVHPRPAASEISAERAAREGEVKAKVRRVGEPVQADAELIGLVEHAGVVRGTEVTVRPTSQGVQLTADDGAQVVLPAEVARHVFLDR